MEKDWLFFVMHILHIYKLSSVESSHSVLIFSQAYINLQNIFFQHLTVGTPGIRGDRTIATA